MTDRRTFLASTSAMLHAAPLSADGQPAGKVYSIGLLSIGTDPARPCSIDWPASTEGEEYVEDGGLMTYSANHTSLLWHAAIYVDKILKGAKAADLPVEQPTKFELAINPKTAKALGLTIPPSVLGRADGVIH
jgi:ABC transporter substrate binding protein